MHWYSPQTTTCPLPISHVGGGGGGGKGGKGGGRGMLFLFFVVVVTKPHHGYSVLPGVMKKINKNTAGQWQHGRVGQDETFTMNIYKQL